MLTVRRYGASLSFKDFTTILKSFKIFISQFFLFIFTYLGNPQILELNMSATLLVIHLIITLAMIVLVLQRSEGGALVSVSSGGNMFSSRGVGNALIKMTTILALCFF